MRNRVGAMNDEVIIVCRRDGRHDLEVVLRDWIFIPHALTT
jgi:hypothetical protein